MHELALVQGIIGNLEAKKVTHNFTKVCEVEIICGKYNCLSQESLQFCFDAMAKEPYIKGARLKIKRVEAGFECAECDAEFPEPGKSGACPECGSDSVVDMRGSKMYIKRLEVEE